jgi:nitronate monooxygenase
MDPDNLPDADKSSMNFGSGGNTKSKAWKDIWGSGQGIGGIKDVQSVENVVAEMERDYRASIDSLVARAS